MDLDFPDETENENEEKIIKEAQRLKKAIKLGNKNYPEEMLYAFCVVLMVAVKKDYEEFVKDLGLEEADRAEILQGMLEKKIKSFWSDIETIVDFGGKIMDEFNKVRKEGGRKEK